MRQARRKLEAILCQPGQVLLQIAQNQEIHSHESRCSATR